MNALELQSGSEVLLLPNLPGYPVTVIARQDGSNEEVASLSQEIPQR